MRNTFYNIKNKRWRIALRAFCVLLCISVLCQLLALGIGAETEIPTESSITKNITYIYNWAKRYTGYSSFKNYCAHYVNTQLLLLDINKRYVGGNGNDEYDNYKDLSYTAGGRKIHDYPATNATFEQVLRTIASKGRVVTDVLVGFQWTSTTAGNKYGHSFLIRGIIGEYVYFSDSFNITIGGKYYKEGEPIKCTIDQLVSYYGRESAYTLEGLIWFEDEELSAALDELGGDGGGGTSVDQSELGTYKITYNAGMRLRAGPGQSYDTLAIMPKGTEMDVTEIKGGWGYTYYEGQMGWCCLPGYTKKTGSLPPFIIDKYDGSKLFARDTKTNLPEAMALLTDTDKYNYTVSAYANIVLTADTAIPAGVTLSLGTYSVTAGRYTFKLDGGIVRAGKEVPALKEGGAVSETVNGDEYVYTSFTPEMAFTGVSLILTDNVCLRFTAKVDGISAMKNSEVVMISKDAMGIVSEYKPDQVKNGIYTFTTDGIPSKELADKLTLTLCIRSSSLGAAGEIRGGQITYSPADYVKSSYGSGELFDELLASMLNYGTEAQKYFNYNSSTPANSVLPLNARDIESDGSVLVKANAAPIVNGTSSVHITSAQLVLLDNVALRLHSSGDAGKAKLSLLVWSESDYRALKQRAEAAGKNVSDYLVKGNETYALTDEEGSFTLDDIAAKEFADTYYFRLAQTEGGKINYDYVFSYSVTSYCADKLGDNVTEDIDALCMAIAQYSAAAREYFGYKINGK